jgi:cytosine/adenosine deaminase-related metal-dependent hydrolase
MGVEKYRATGLFDGTKLYGSEKILIMDQNGMVLDLQDAEGSDLDLPIEPNILMPGLINAHCHLELSHLKDVIPPHTGLIEFLCSVVTKRDFSPERIQLAIEQAEAEMAAGGIVAVGDIGNTADTLRVKSRSKIWWQNFVEVLSFTDENSDTQMKHYADVQTQLQWDAIQSGNRYRTVMVPHAPYSISPKTFRALNEASAHQIISIHNQEHPAENDLYQTGGGAYLALFSIFGMRESPFPVTGKNSLASVLPYFTKGQTIFLVHNTSTTEADIDFAMEHARLHQLQLIWCLCPNANLYIENKLPPLELLHQKGCRMVVGTDSYSSNWQLSIQAEINTLRMHYPDFPLEVLLQMATRNGAIALGWDDQLGSFEKGKKPGLARL